ncbi:MAG TPA: hypothetical protein ENK23_01495 [Sorangium sp.]|nr:hypothetical protein [Sorangium sp.]
MKYHKVLFLIAVSCLANGAHAQVDPSMDSWSFMTGDDGGTASAAVYAEGLADNVVVEHWVVRNPDDWGFDVEGGGLDATGERYESSRDFLHHMWRQSVEVDEQWYYARQTVVYTPLAEAASMDWFDGGRLVGCLSLVDETGQIVGRQIRTRAWSLFTDHWVLYPEYRSPTQGGRVSFIDVTDDGCLMPRELIASEFNSARNEADIDEYRHATATFSLVPLVPFREVGNNDKAAPTRRQRGYKNWRSYTGTRLLGNRSGY